MAVDLGVRRGGLGWWVGHGAVAGILAGVLFIMFQMLIAAFQTAGEGFFLPLRAMATIVAGPDAMQPDYSLTRAVLLGLATNLVLAAVGGMVLALFAGLVRALSSSDVGLIGLGAFYGFGLWFNAGLGLAPDGWAAYLRLSDPLIQ